MHETILTLAENLTGAAETEKALLGLLCTAAEQGWSDRLRDGLTPAGCESAYVCACALSAAASLLAGRDGSAESFRAGDVSVTAKNSGQAAVSALYEQAARLMAPYVFDDGFCFKGVRA